MKSFALRIEPAPDPRLAGFVLILHLVAATLPWLTRCPAGLAAAMTAAALAGLCSSIAWLPGPHRRLRVLELDRASCRVSQRPGAGEQAAALGPGCRAWPGLVVLDLRTGGRRLGWLLSRASLPPRAFRRLKARVRLAC